MVEQSLVILWIIFSWVKVDKVTSFVGKIFVVRSSTMHENHEYFISQKYPGKGINHMDLNLLPMPKQ